MFIGAPFVQGDGSVLNSGLHYKHLMSSYDDRHEWRLYYKWVIAFKCPWLEIVASLTDDPRGIIYDQNIFIMQAMV
jgi:hypothetical protein